MFSFFSHPFDMDGDGAFSAAQQALEYAVLSSMEEQDAQEQDVDDPL